MKKIFAVVLAACFPVIVLAQQAPVNTTYIDTLIGGARGILNVAIPIILTIATIYFLWTVFAFMRAKDDKDRNEGRKKMTAGIIGLAVAVSVWGIVRLLVYTFGINQTGSIRQDIPCPPGLAWSQSNKRCE